MTYNLYIDKIVEPLVISTDYKDNNALFIKYYNVLKFSKNEIADAIKKNNRNMYLLFHKYDDNPVTNPYDPFLDWIRELYHVLYENEMAIDDFLEACHVYPLQKDLFSSYIKTGVCRRKEHVLLSEVGYEQKRFLNSLKNIFLYVSQKQSLFIVLHNVNQANYAAMVLLRHLIKMAGNKHIGFLCTYNETQQVPQFMEENWEKLKAYIEKNNMIFNWDVIYKEKQEKKENAFVPSIEKLPDYILNITNMYYTLSNSQAIYCIELLSTLLEGQKSKMKKEDVLQLVFLRIMLYVLDGQYTRALLYCDEVYKKYFMDATPYIKFLYYYMVSLASCQLEKTKDAIYYAKECKAQADALKEPFYEFKAAILDCIVAGQGWKDIYAINEYPKISEQLIEQCKEYEQWNTLAHLYIFSFPSKLKEDEDEPENIKLGIQIGERLDNIDFLMWAYSEKIRAYSGQGHYEQIDGIYKKMISLLKHEGNKNRLIDMYNATGYNCLITEQYGLAHEYFCEALCLDAQKQRVSDMGVCLYNMATNCILAGEYEIAREYLMIVIQIIKDLRIRGLHLCKTAKLYGLTALCNYYLDSEYYFFLYLNKMERVLNPFWDSNGELDEKDWSNELFLYYFIKGLVSKKEDNLEETKANFDMAQKYCDLDKNYYFFSYPILAIQQALLYREVGEVKKADDVLKECIAYCEEKEYYEKVKCLKAVLNGKEPKYKKRNFELRDITIEQILSLSKKVGQKTEFLHKQRDIDFLSKWQNILIQKDREIGQLFKNSINIIANSFNLDEVLCLKKTNAGYEIIYGDPQRKQILNEKKVEAVFHSFSNQLQGFVVNKTDNHYMQHYNLVKLLQLNTMETIVGIPLSENDEIKNVFLGFVSTTKSYNANQVMLSDEDAAIIKFAYGQLIAAVDKYKNQNEIEKMNERLNNMAVTDLLTGLYNRQGFSQMLEHTGNQKKQSCIVMYVDLDNFKYYNDTFGHDVGDMILKSYGVFFKTIVGNTGYAVRYGGDEFVLVLLEKDKAFGMQVAEDIYQYIKEELVKKLEETVGKSLDVPENKKIGCSIGMAYCTAYDNDGVQEGLNKADQALYYAKKVNKGTYLYWDDIPAE